MSLEMEIEIMAKLTAPLLSFGGRGQIGKTMVTAKWRGVPYARQYVIPANPNTVAQQTTRTTFAVLREMWKLSPPLVQAAWNAFASGRPFTGMNKWVGENMRVIRGETDLDNLIFSPGARGGLIPLNVMVTTGANAGEIDITADAPTAPDGWTVNSLVAAAVPDADPTADFFGPFIAGSDNAAPYTITLGGLGSGVDCEVGVWLVWNKPNGDLAYSPSQTYQATSHA